MLQGKDSIGFPTPNKELADTFAKIQTELSQKKANWQSLNQILTTALEIAFKTMDPKEMNTSAVFAIATLSYIAKLGIEITETHERLAKVEKAIKALQLKLK